MFPKIFEMRNPTHDKNNINITAPNYLISNIYIAALSIMRFGFVNGFFMNWNGNQAGEGFEYHLLVLGLAFALILRGGGRASLDRSLSAR